MKDIFSLKAAALVTGLKGYRSMIAAGFLSSERKFISVPGKRCLRNCKKLSEEYGGECISIPVMFPTLGIEAH